MSSFLDKYERLPFMSEDDVEIEIPSNKGDKEVRPYRSSRYITEYYETQENLTEVLFDKKIITYKLIADILGLTEAVVRNAITKETKNPQPEVRRKLDIFFNKDLYSELGIYANLCNKCTKRCKQHYFVDVKCRKYKERK